MRSVTQVMDGLLARLYKPLDKTDNPLLTDCTLSVRVRSTTDAQEQEQSYQSYVDYKQKELPF